MALESRGTKGLDYRSFRQRLDCEMLTGHQSGPLKLRLELLESFLEDSAKAGVQSFIKENEAYLLHLNKKERQKRQAEQAAAAEARARAWKFEPGTLTIIDLSCQFVDESTACMLFSICLDIFLEDRDSAGRIVALDEAHKVNLSLSLFWNPDIVLSPF